MKCVFDLQINPENYIFLYGGDDLDWIRRFTMAAKATAKDSNVKLEMAYVGKRNHSHREQIRRISEAVRAENLSHSWAEPALMWFFWARLESMLYSKIQLGKSDDQDEVGTRSRRLLLGVGNSFKMCGQILGDARNQEDTELRQAWRMGTVEQRS